jgi:hypothetical protein
VAALTMPALITDYQKKQTVTHLKRNMARLSQAGRMASLDYETFEFKSQAKVDMIAYYEQYLFPYNKTLKICTDTVADCGINNNYQYINGGNMNGRFVDAYAIAAILT